MRRFTRLAPTFALLTGFAATVAWAQNRPAAAPVTRPAAGGTAATGGDDSDKAIQSLRTEQDLATYQRLIDSAVENARQKGEQAKRTLDEQRAKVEASFASRKQDIDARRTKVAPAERARLDVELDLAAQTRDYQTGTIDLQKAQVDQQVETLAKTLGLRKAYAGNVFALVKKLASLGRDAPATPAGEKPAKAKGG